MNRRRTHRIQPRTSRTHAVRLVCGVVAKQDTGEWHCSWQVRFAPAGWTQNGTSAHKESGCTGCRSFSSFPPSLRDVKFSLIGGSSSAVFSFVLVVFRDHSGFPPALGRIGPCQLFHVLCFRHIKSLHITSKKWITCNSRLRYTFELSLFVQQRNWKSSEIQTTGSILCKKQKHKNSSKWLYCVRECFSMFSVRRCLS